MDKYLSPSTSSIYENAQPAKIRKYDNSYIIEYLTENDNGRTKCVVCLQVLAYKAMKPAKLERHVITKYPEFYQHEDYN